jgi:hypothetical protein
LKTVNSIIYLFSIYDDDIKKPQKREQTMSYITSASIELQAPAQWAVSKMVYKGLSTTHKKSKKRNPPQIAYNTTPHSKTMRFIINCYASQKRTFSFSKFTEATPNARF